MDSATSGGRPQPDGAWQRLPGPSWRQGFFPSNIGVYLEERGNGDMDLFIGAVYRVSAVKDCRHTSVRLCPVSDDRGTRLNEHLVPVLVILLNCGQDVPSASGSSRLKVLLKGDSVNLDCWATVFVGVSLLVTVIREHCKRSAVWMEVTKSIAWAIARQFCCIAHVSRRRNPGPDPRGHQYYCQHDHEMSGRDRAPRSPVAASPQLRLSILGVEIAPDLFDSSVTFRPVVSGWHWVRKR